LNPKGFTLIEVLVGLIILSIGLLGIAGMQITSVKGNSFSNHITQASYVAQDRIEFLKNISMTSDLLKEGNHNDGTATIAGTDFNRSYKVTFEKLDGSFRKIAYKVKWFDGVSHDLTFTTSRAQ
jgi:type IV pilus modification protein PilV